MVAAACSRSSPAARQELAGDSGSSVPGPAASSVRGAEVPGPGPEAKTQGDSADASRTARESADASRASEASAATARSEVSPVGALKLDRPVDLGPAAPSTAASRGVLVRTREGDVESLALDERSADPRKGAHSSGEHWALRGPPPMVTSSSHVYWVARGKLLRRAVRWSFEGSGSSERGEEGASGKAPDTLATDALDGARVAAESAPSDAFPSGRRDLVAYVARPSAETDELTSRLWVEGTDGGSTRRLSGDGAGASSVALVALDPPSSGRFWAVSIDARSAMSPVHAMTIELAAHGVPTLGPDVVAFVGPSPEGHVEVTALAARERELGVFAFIPFSRDTSSFGLAALSLGSEPRVDVQVHWKMYPAGLEPAPIGVARFCESAWVAYVRPSTPAPSAPSLLVLAPFEHGELGAETIAAEGFDFRYVSLAPREDGGAWLAWVGNGRTWARGLRVARAVHGTRGEHGVGCE